MPPKLGVNIDHIATLRQVRKSQYPKIIEAVKVAESAGADGITVHLREDRRHIQDADVAIIRQFCKTRLNLEIAACLEMVDKAVQYKPDECCLVPERREELTTEGGLEVAQNIKKLKPIVQTLQSEGIRVSLFIDAQEAQVKASEQLGVDAVEFHTGSYANAQKAFEREQWLNKIQQSIKLAQQLNIETNAGHGLTLYNLAPIASIQGLSWLNIGHALVCEALFVGLDSSIKSYLNKIKESCITRSKP